ncbi:MAG TPA: tetratricopeptide repeat protein, partial [Ferruginibacter sp.]|nr:tetratricopeptide repeat protein [Ferruginibacter sp.]
MKNTSVIMLLLACLLSTGSLLAQTSTEYNNQGLVKFKAKNYAAALQDLNKAVELDAKNDKALHNRG